MGTKIGDVAVGFTRQMPSAPGDEGKKEGRVAAQPGTNAGVTAAHRPKAGTEVDGSLGIPRMVKP